GLAMSTKYTMASFILPLLAAHVVASCRVRRGGARGTVLISPLLLAGVVALAAFLVGTPFAALDGGRFIRDIVATSRTGVGGRWLGQPTGPVPLLYVATLLQGLGLAPLLAAVVGAVVSWRSRRAACVVVAILPLCYLGFMATRSAAFPRFALPTLPFLCLFAGLGLVWLMARLSLSKLRLGQGVLVALTLAQSLANDALQARLLLQRDTRILANQWVQANLPPGSHVMIEHYSLWDLSSRGRTFTPNTARLRVEQFRLTLEGEAARGYLPPDADYVVTSSLVFDRYFVGSPRPRWAETASRYAELHRKLDDAGDVVARFSPGWGGRELPYRLEDAATPFWSLDEYERPGPTLRVYRLARGEPSA
ncbi:MAG: hypothetical protein IT307_10235, partial [Chloroflexi bacterium]|nr:hypothetical protein [Chloroflexota bacterium]